MSYVIESNPLAPEGPASSGPGVGVIEKAGPRHFLLDRAGLQLPAAVIAAAAPLFYYTWDPYASTSLLGMLDAYAGSLASVTLGYYVLKRVTSFPTSHAPAAVLPIFAGSFALVLGMLASLGWRFDAEPVSIGFALSVAWLTGVLYVAERARRRQFALLPIGHTLSLMSQPGPQLEGAGRDADLALALRRRRGRPARRHSRAIGSSS